ncbi:MAG: type II secretion system protein [bacterium]
MLNNTKGFSLMETLIYIAILSLIIGGLFSFSLTIATNRNKAYAAQEVQSNIRSLITAINADMRTADDVVSPTAGNGQASLVLDMGTNPDVTYSVTDGVFYRTEGVGDAIAVSTAGVLIESVVFKNLATANDRDNIELTAIVSYSGSDSQDFRYSQNLQTAFSLKK